MGGVFCFAGKHLTISATQIIIVCVYGPVAQLGAHHIRIVGVGSSNLLRSTNKRTPPVWVVFFVMLLSILRRFERLKATVRWTVAPEGLTEGNKYFLPCRKSKRISSGPPTKKHHPFGWCFLFGMLMENPTEIEDQYAYKDDSSAKKGCLIRHFVHQQKTENTG